jgi:ABC-type multidrug transport system fused ATPase/permease subunit
MQAVAALHGSKTIIIVAHRLSTVSNCDRLYRQEDGRIVHENLPPARPASVPRTA